MKVEKIIVHCSASEWGCRNAIHQWHKDRGWNGIGYHFVIQNNKPFSDLYLDSVNGAIEQGRCINLPGAHSKGDNHNSLGICLIGKSDFSNLQILSLVRLLDDLMKMYNLTPNVIIGHYETESGESQGKTCPNIDMRLIRKSLEKERLK